MLKLFYIERKKFCLSFFLIFVFSSCSHQNVRYSKFFKEFQWESPFQLLKDESEINWKYSNDVDFPLLSISFLLLHFIHFSAFPFHSGLFWLIAPIAIQTNPSPWPIVEPVFHFGPGFDHPHYCPTHSQGPPPHEHIVFFHVNPGVSVTFQISGNREVIRGKFNQALFHRLFFPFLICHLKNDNSRMQFKNKSWKNIHIFLTFKCASSWDVAPIFIDNSIFSLHNAKPFAQTHTLTHQWTYWNQSESGSQVVRCFSSFFFHSFSVWLSYWRLKINPCLYIDCGCCWHLRMMLCFNIHQFFLNETQNDSNPSRVSAIAKQKPAWGVCIIIYTQRQHTLHWMEKANSIRIESNSLIWTAAGRKRFGAHTVDDWVYRTGIYGY